MNQKLRRNKSIWLMVIVLIASVVLLSIASILPNQNIHNNPNLSGVAKDKYDDIRDQFNKANPNRVPDPNYPVEKANEYYTLTVPSLKERLHTSKDGNTATLYSPYVDGAKSSVEGNWYDAKQKGNDENLDWAYADSNILAWYLNIIKNSGFDTKYYETNVDGIYKNYSDAWMNKSWSKEYSSTAFTASAEGLNWYFTGKFSNGEAGYFDKPLYNPNTPSGGFMRGLPNVPSSRDQFYQVNFPANPDVYGNIVNEYTHIPFYENITSILTKPEHNHIKSFSKLIIRQLHYGAVTLYIKNTQDGVNDYFINCWGADYDTTTGDITSLYVTDNTDPSAGIMPVKVQEHADGVEILLDGEGADAQLISGALVLFSPDVAQVKEHIPQEDYTGPEGTINDITMQNGRVTISADNVSNETLEYAISYYADGHQDIRWQDSNVFDGLSSGAYSFFVRVKETKEHYAGKMSAPQQVVVSNDSDLMSIRSISLGNSAVTGYDKDTNAYKYVWYGDIGGNPILWRVLDTHANNYEIYEGNLTPMEDNGLLLLSESILSKEVYYTVKNKNNYIGSNAQYWVRNFVSPGANHFSQSELEAMISTTKTDNLYHSGQDPRYPEQSIDYSRNPYILDNDKMFLLSVEELKNSIYGLEVTNGDKVYTNRQAKYLGEVSDYWSRSKKDNHRNVTCVGLVDSGVKSGVSFMNATLDAGMRPAFNLNKDKILFSSAVGIANTSIDQWHQISTVQSNGMKLTIKDDSRYFRLAEGQNKISIYTGGQISLQYTGAQVGDDEYISAIIVDGNNTPVYYGKIGKVVKSEGTITFSLPIDINNGDYTIKVFNEKENGDMRTNYASSFVDIALTVEGNHSHDWTNKQYVWADDYSSVTATADCVSGAGHSVSMTVDTTYVDNAGKRTYTAEFSEPFVTQTKVVNIKDQSIDPIPPIDSGEIPGGNETNPDEHNKPIDPDIKPNPGEDKDKIDLVPIQPGESIAPDNPDVQPEPTEPSEPDIKPDPTEPNEQDQGNKPNGNETISQDNSLSSGAVAGIAIGSVAGIGAIGVGVFFLAKYLRKRG